MTAATKDAELAPLIAHVVFRFGVGGLENGLVNIVNRTATSKYRHAIVCIDESTSFANRITKPGVGVYSIHKKPGRDWRAGKRLFDLMRELKPAIVHTRNLGAMDALLPALVAGVPVRIHGEHGLDVTDLHASKLKFRLLRKLHSPLVTHYIAVSRQLATYLNEKVGIARSRITEIANGVDTERFAPPRDKRQSRQRLLPGVPDDAILVGCVGRLEGVKDPLNLVAAVAGMLDGNADLRDRLRLVIVGDGSLRAVIEAEAKRRSLERQLVLTGNRDDVPTILAALDLFASPSLAEGFSNTILEAMASGLPVVATNVGENARLVADGKIGRIVPPADPVALGAAIASYCRSPERLRSEGIEARQRIEREFAIDRMVAGYEAVYDRYVGNAPEAAVGVDAASRRP
jgi:sugar transferase (PEP-CTERM/EpsH1 system associated)